MTAKMTATTTAIAIPVIAIPLREFTVVLVMRFAPSGSASARFCCRAAGLHLPYHAAAASIPYEDHPSACRIMRFNLRYTGELPSTGNPRGPNKNKPQKLPIIWKIRNEIATQLVGVFNTHPSVSSGGSMASRAAYNMLRQFIERGGYKFAPLVRPEFEAVCSLNIKMLVNHELGSLVTQAGDLDNRIKTLIDALKVPKDDDFNGNIPVENPCPCLLHDDAMIVGLCINVDRWYSNIPKTEKDVELLIDVEIKTLKPNFFIAAFGIE
jgi:hypothetical protein